MPELPEVQTTVTGLKNHIISQRIKSVVFYREKIRYPLESSWISQIENQTILDVYRRAKMIIMQLESGYLLWHLGMSGSLRIKQNNIQRKHDHIELTLSNKKQICYHDPRRFGYLKYYSLLSDLQKSIQHYGIEPLSSAFSGAYLHKQCLHKKSPIKNIIMNQSIVVGVGNIYACEALYYSQIHPNQPANTINKQQATLLCKQIKNTLKKAIKQGGTTLKDFENADSNPGYFQQQLAVYGKKDTKCLTCQTPINSMRITGRNSFFCPSCQLLK